MKIASVIVWRSNKDLGLWIRSVARIARSVKIAEGKLKENTYLPVKLSNFKYQCPIRHQFAFLSFNSILRMSSQQDSFAFQYHFKLGLKA